ncbi:MAG: tRNA lysidine(34) synthetase TilS, partial [Rubricella sp.]
MTLRDHVFERLDGTGADALVLAVSGGGDSTAMLVLAADWARSRGARLFAATIDHGLRAESAEEARFVAGLCEGLGVDHATIGWQAQAEGNLQQEARRARRRLLAEHARACGAQDVILGHTQDDVAETFLMRIERGSGLDGLSAIADRFEAHGVRFHRPLLSCSRSSLRELLTDRGIPWREDPTNADMRFLRSRIRSILPALDTVGLSVERLAETAHRLSDARAALDLHAAALARDTLAETPEGAITLDRALFLEAP